MKIAMDYDNTFTADRPLFAKIVSLMKEHGHDVRFVTYRYEEGPYALSNTDIQQDAQACDIPIIYSNYRQKRDVWDADIWVDDMPELIP